MAHNGSLIPVPGRDIKVQAWYQGGLSVHSISRIRQTPWRSRISTAVPATSEQLVTAWILVDVLVQRLHLWRGDLQGL